MSCSGHVRLVKVHLLKSRFQHCLCFLQTHSWHPLRPCVDQLVLAQGCHNLRKHSSGSAHSRTQDCPSSNDTTAHYAATQPHAVLFRDPSQTGTSCTSVDYHRVSPVHYHILLTGSLHVRWHFHWHFRSASWHPCRP